MGALVVLMGVQLSVLGLYLPPVFKPLMRSVVPPQTIISLPVHTAVGSIRPSGAFVMLVGVQVLSVHVVFTNSPSVKASDWYVPLMGTRASTHEARCLVANAEA